VAELIESGNAGTAGDAQIAIDAAGNAIAVWWQDDGTRNNIWTNRYTIGVGWGTAQLLETSDLGDAGRPHVAIDSSGNAIAVWQQFDGSRDSIWANRYTANQGWSTPQLLEADNRGEAVGARVVIDGSGNAIAVWEQDDGTQINIVANRYEVGTGWGTARLIETSNSGRAFRPQIAMSANGDAVVVWEQDDASNRSNVWANRYAAGAGWETAQLIETLNADAFSPHVTIDANGNAMAVWEQSIGLQSTIWAKRYAAGAGWDGAQTPIETNNLGEASGARVATDANGNVVAVWSEWDGTHENIWTNRYTAGAGWGTAQLIETDDSGNASGAQVAVDADGTAMAVWSQSDGQRNNAWANRYVAGTGWGTAQLIETNDAGTILGPQVAIGAGGHVMAIWEHDDAAAHQFSIWANVFR